VPVNGKPLIVYHLEKLSAIGIKDVVINISYLADQIRDALGDGKKFDLNIIYSYEPEVLETGGGIVQALPLLGDEPFLVISSDIYTDYPYENLLALCHPEAGGIHRRISLGDNCLAHLILVPNPPFHPEGDFSLDSTGRISNTPAYTYANLGVYHPDLFRDCSPGKYPLGPLLRKAADLHLLTGDIYKGIWYNVGTYEELEKLEQFAKGNG
ncbi:MAG: nucleotidyltransferase family protein, partial [Gammaproteobacteria bacterium]|nr:nucleotidyltransferase family protein [Gammaproteobacteria bacterium]